MYTISKAAVIAALACAIRAQNSSLPIVDLGYELQQASGYNVCVRLMGNNIKY